MIRGPNYDKMLAENRRQADRPTDVELARPPLPLLVTGITGVAGYNALAYFQSRFPGQVFGLLPPKTKDFAAPDMILANADSLEELDAVFEKHRFGAVLDCAGNCDLKGCQLDPQLAWTLNVDIVRNLSRWTRKLAIRLVHLSVDLVFGGKPGGNYVETDPTDPVTMYGRTMVEGEKGIIDEDPYAVTLRISLPMGVSFNGHAGAIDWISSRFKKGVPATLLYDEIRTPTYTDCLNRVCRVMLANDIAGLFHCGTPRQLSLYNIAQVLNRVGGFDSDLLYGLYRDEMGPIPPRAGNVAMNSEKLAVFLGYPPIDPWPVDERFVPTNKRWHADRSERETGNVSAMYEHLAWNRRRYI